MLTATALLTAGLGVSAAAPNPAIAATATLQVSVTANTLSWTIKWPAVTGAVRYTVARAMSDPARGGLTWKTYSTSGTSMTIDASWGNWSQVGPGAQIPAMSIRQAFKVTAYNVRGNKIVDGVGGSCPKLAIISARGSGEDEALYADRAPYSLGSRGRETWYNLTRTLHVGQSVISADAVYYVAMSVPSAIAQGGTTYNISRANGVEDLDGLISAAHGACPSARFILVGYSQGAQVVADWYQGRPTLFGTVAHVVLIADAGRNAADKGALYPVQTRNNAANWNGLMGSRPAFASNETSRVNSWCWLGDMVCNKNPANFGQFHSRAKLTADKFGLGTAAIAALIWPYGDAGDPYTKCFQGSIRYNLINGLMAHGYWPVTAANPTPTAMPTWCTAQH